jgi:hypothetical protein
MYVERLASSYSTVGVVARLTLTLKMRVGGYRTMHINNKTRLGHDIFCGVRVCSGVSCACLAFHGPPNNTNKEKQSLTKEQDGEQRILSWIIILSQT